MIQDATHSSVGSDSLEAIAKIEAGAEVVEPDSTNDQETNDATSESELEDIEFEGVTHQVPKSLKDAFLRQADYTRKTQELADSRRAFETKRDQLAQSSQEELLAQASLLAKDQQLAQFKEVDWQAWLRANPLAAQEAFMAFTQLKEQRNEAAAHHAALKQHREVQSAADKAKRIEEGFASLSKDIPGWSEEMAGAALAGGVKEYGFHRSEIEDFEDPRMVKVLVDALEWRKHQAQQKKADILKKQQAVKPAATVNSSNAPSTGLDDRLSADEWVRRRNAQLRKG